MRNIFENFYRIIDELNNEGVEYILIGGFAVILYGLPRLTEDIDIFISPDQDNVAKFKTALKRIYNDASIEEINIGMLNEYAVVRYGTPSGFYVDILTRLGEAFSYHDLEYEIKNIEGHRIRIASVPTLIKMKSDTLRSIDAEDVFFLKSLLQDRDNGEKK